MIKTRKKIALKTEWPMLDPQQELGLMKTSDVYLQGAV